MEAEKVDQVADTIAFLLARIRGDSDAAVAILGENEEFMGPQLLMGMTDLAYGMTKLLAVVAGTTPETLVETMAMTNKFIGRS